MKKLHKIPAQIAEPITPDELHAIPCISKKFVGSSLSPIKCTSRAEPGTAETPAAPSNGLILSFRNRFIILAKIRPDAVAMEKAINDLPGVVTNGLFALRPADLVLVAGKDGIKKV